ncbi:MAG: hypothetical protein J5797_12625 [Prevotella sp.]|nr:hypothetical protein [Prevotella sp.]
MKKLFSLAIVVVLLVSMAVTCPKEEAHYDAVTTSISEKSSVAKPLVKFILDKGVKSFVEVKDYFLVSVGSYNLNDKNGFVSLGVFGHVYTFTGEDFWTELGRWVGLK